MARTQKLLVIILRVAVGWFLLYQGITAFFSPSWSLMPYIEQAKTFHDFYIAIRDSAMLPYAGYVIKGLFVVSGLLLMTGFFARIGALLGMLVMLFFYFPVLDFPYVFNVFNPIASYYIVDQNLLIVLVLAYLYVIRSGEYFGFGSKFRFSKY